MYAQDESKTVKYQTTRRGGLVCKRHIERNPENPCYIGTTQDLTQINEHVYSFQQSYASCNHPVLGSGFSTQFHSSIFICYVVSSKINDFRCAKPIMNLSCRDHLYVTLLTGFINGNHWTSICHVTRAKTFERSLSNPGDQRLETWIKCSAISLNNLRKEVIHALFAFLLSI